MSLDCQLFQFIEPDPLVFCEQQPAALAHKREPGSVLSSRREISSVTLVSHIVERERIENGLAVVKIFVEIKNEFLRQQRLPCSAPTGLLLRSAVA
jgi:hypothetical protein